jgi:uncharacterized protein (DUF1501 family)
MAITRRQFLRRSGLAAAGGMLGPGLLANPFIRKALADTIGDRYFVIVYLDGGNDGLNTVVPYDNGNGSLRSQYIDPDNGRKTGPGGLQLSTTALNGTVLGAVGSNPGTDPNTQGTLAVHPGLIGLKNLYDAGKVAVVQGCGYPAYNLSHEQSRHVWQKGDPTTTLANGWLGRYLAANYVGTDIPGVNITDRIAGEFEQSATSVLALGRLVDFGFPYQDYGSDNPFQKGALLDLLAAAASGSQPAIRQFLGNSGIATIDASDTYPLLDAEYTSARSSFDDQYTNLDSGFANDIREVAKVIWGVANNAHTNVKARFFEVSNGGYDTHSDQGGATGQQYDLHRTVGDALEVFYNDCDSMVIGGEKVSDKLCIVIWSEFSRRIQQNDNGTDHGSQGPVFVIGGSVNGGVYGNHPNIDPNALNDDGNTQYSQDNGNGFRSTDLRDVYGTILERWLGMSHSTILSTVLPLDVGSPSDYWTAENFNLGFLP